MGVFEWLGLGEGRGGLKVKGLCEENPGVSIYELTLKSMRTLCTLAWRDAISCRELSRLVSAARALGVVLECCGAL